MLVCENPNCRHANPDDAPYCAECGRPLPRPAPPPPPESPHPRGVGAEKRRSPILFYLAIWVPILIVVAFLIAFC